MFKTDAKEIIEDAISSALRPGMTADEAKAALVEAISPLIEKPTEAKVTVVRHAGTSRVCGPINITISEVPYI